jgi:hypothetical protein
MRFEIDIGEIGNGRSRPWRGLGRTLPAVLIFSGVGYFFFHRHVCAWFLRNQNAC